MIPGVRQRTHPGTTRETQAALAKPSLATAMMRRADYIALIRPCYALSRHVNDGLQDARTNRCKRREPILKVCFRQNARSVETSEKIFSNYVAFASIHFES